MPVIGKLVRVDPHEILRLERMREELSRRAVKDMGGADLELTFAAVHRIVLGKGLDDFERSFKLPELPEPEKTPAKKRRR